MASTAHLPTSARFRARPPGPVSGQLYETAGGGAGHAARFPAAFRPPAFASWASCPAREFGPPYGRLTENSVPDPDGVYMFRTRETPPGPGALCTPGTAVPAQSRVHPVTAACRLATAGPCRPGHATRPGRFPHEASARVHWRSPHPGLPLTCDPQAEQGSLGFTLSSAPGRAGPSHARQGGDEPQALTRSHVTGITGLLQRGSLHTSGLMSQCIRKVPSARRGQDHQQALSSQAKGTSYMQKIKPSRSLA